eukprot:TRINITY_DN1851_c0_g1_i1.p1 TRINITY_DN1851_c0_g1~~TRINITY_DN1851_c0_g1_i1.p1  ORF type:complete len:252 (+),score=50.58 TRINITY_DN1851_c0_g1_i1:151-906(+)
MVCRIIITSCLCLFMLSTLDAAYIRPKKNPVYPPIGDSTQEFATLPPFIRYQCVEINVYALNEATGHTWKSTFYPRVDEFTQMELPYTAHPLFMFNPNLTVWVEFQGINTTAKHTFDPINNVFIPYMVVMIQLDKGAYTGISWQDGCSQCRDIRCVDLNCGETRDPNVTSTDDICNKVNCNIKFYLAWTGRDANDANLLTASSTPTNFNKYSITPFAKFGNGLWDDFIYNVKSTGQNEATKVPGRQTEYSN